MQLVTVATFDSPPKAHLAVGLLSESGIDAFLSNERLVADQWDTGQASQGIQVRVDAAFARRAHGLIEQAEFGGGSRQGELLNELDEDDDPFDDALPGESPEQRANFESANVAFRTAAVGLAFPPLQLYSLWVLARLSTRLSHGRSSPRIRRRIFAALGLDLFIVFATVSVIAVIWFS